MTAAKARAELARTMSYLHLSDEEFTITNGHLVSKNGAMDFPVEELIAIIPAHGTVMAVYKRGDMPD